MNKYILFDTANHCDIDAYMQTATRRFSLGYRLTVAHCLEQIHYLETNILQILFSHLINGLSKAVCIQTIHEIFLRMCVFMCGEKSRQMQMFVIKFLSGAHTRTRTHLRCTACNTYLNSNK